MIRAIGQFIGKHFENAAAKAGKAYKGYKAANYLKENPPNLPEGVAESLAEASTHRFAGLRRGGKVKKRSYASGGSVSSASKRADGIAVRGKTRCKIV